MPGRLCFEICNKSIPLATATAFAEKGCSGEICERTCFLVVRGTGYTCTLCTRYPTCRSSLNWRNPMHNFTRKCNEPYNVNGVILVKGCSRAHVLTCSHRVPVPGYPQFYTVEIHRLFSLELGISRARATCQWTGDKQSRIPRHKTAQHRCVRRCP